MTTFSVSIPEALGHFVEKRVVEGGYSAADEYVGELIREDQKRTSHERLEDLLLEGLDSGPAIEMNDEYWKRKREALIARHSSNTNEGEGLSGPIRAPIRISMSSPITSPATVSTLLSGFNWLHGKRFSRLRTCRAWGVH